MADPYDTDYRRAGRSGSAPKQCGFETCPRDAFARGLCRSHYRQWVKGRQLHPLKSHVRVVDGMKRCGDCGETKPISDFHKKLQYVAAQCRSCYNIRLRAKTYRLTLEQVEEMMQRPCETCGAVVSGRELHIDHCHDTGKVRGVLCHRCNTVLTEHVTPELLRRMADYLER